MSWTARLFCSGPRLSSRFRFLPRATAATVASSAVLYAITPPIRIDKFESRDENELHQVFTDHKLTKREIRFLKYASIEYDDVVYMTAADFLDSLTLDSPRERIFRRVLTESDVQRMLRKTPPLRKNSDHLFRDINENGLISYADYVFLLTLLTKSKSAFRIAFMMFDDDESEQIDKEEFMLIRSLMASLRSSRSVGQKTNECQLDASEYNLAVQHLQGQRLMTSDSYSMAFDKSDDEVKCQNTTLLLHLFGLSGHNALTYQQFRSFYDNLQYEVMVLEFTEFARGKSLISPIDFAHLVLRYSLLDKKEYSEYIERVSKRTAPDHPGISLNQWASFSIFLNNLQQFTTAVRLYTNAEMPVSKAEFARAVQCTTGQKLADEIIDLIFAIFDANGDGKLSYREFLSIMNDRLHRGLKDGARMVLEAVEKLRNLRDVKKLSISTPSPLAS